MAAIAEVIHNDCLEVREDSEALLSLQGLPMPLTLRLPVPLTDQELIRFSHANRPYQIERNAEGELEIMSPSGFAGSSRELFTGRILGNWADEHGGVTVGASAGFKIGAIEVRCPDAAWVSDKTVAQLTKAEAEGFAPFRPEFLIEVRSRKDSRLRLEKKMQLWIDAGTRLAWMIDPFRAEVLIYRPGAERERLERPDWVEAESVVPGFRLETARMWEK